jgi:VanZ family protein
LLTSLGTHDPTDSSITLRLSRLAVVFILIVTAVPAGLRDPETLQFQFIIRPRDVLGNIILYLPFGLFAQSNLAAPAVVGLASGISATVEIAQIGFVRRYPSLVDVLCNVLGALCGAAAGRFLFKLRTDRVKLGTIGGVILIAGAAGVGLMYFSISSALPAFMGRGALCVVSVLSALGWMALFQPHHILNRAAIGFAGGGMAAAFLVPIIRMPVYAVLAIGMIFGLAAVGCCSVRGSAMLGELSSPAVDKDYK